MALSQHEALAVWQRLNASAISLFTADLSARQAAILLAVYLSPEAQTVRGLAAALSISKPAVSRAVEVLSRAGLVRRRRDEADRRSIFLQRTLKGTQVLAEMADAVRHTVGLSNS